MVIFIADELFLGYCMCFESYTYTSVIFGNLFLGGRGGIYSGVEKLTQSSLKGISSGPFLLLKMGILQAVFSAEV